MAALTDAETTILAKVTTANGKRADSADPARDELGKLGQALGVLCEKHSSNGQAAHIADLADDANGAAIAAKVNAILVVLEQAGLTASS
jgi:hypothetical protein